MISMSRHETRSRCLFGLCIKRLVLAISQSDGNIRTRRLRKNRNINRPKRINHVIIDIDLHGVGSVACTCRQAGEIERIAFAHTERLGRRSADRDTANALGSIRQHFRLHFQSNECRDMLELEVHTTIRNGTCGISKRTDASIVIIHGCGGRQTDHHPFLRTPRLADFGIAGIHRISFTTFQSLIDRSKCSSGCMSIRAIHQIALSSGEERNLVTGFPKGTDTVPFIIEHNARVVTCTGSDPHFPLRFTRHDSFFFRTACHTQRYQGKQHMFEFHIFFILLIHICFLLLLQAEDLLLCFNLSFQFFFTR